MIKIIKHGKYNIAKCYSCECEFSYEKEDTRIAQTGMNEWQTSVKCPECGEEVVV